MYRAFFALHQICFRSKLMTICISIRQVLSFGIVASLLFSAEATQAAILTNGSFETGTLPTPDGTTFTAGSTAIKGWVVGGHGIDYIAAYWQASNGSRSIDLDSGTILGAGPYDGSISQTFSTTIGQSYDVTFDMAGNPDGLPTAKSARVSAAGQFADFTFVNSNQTHAAMGYLP
jgi:choice-of-anchor C domain-containing protein